MREITIKLRGQVWFPKEKPKAEFKHEDFDAIILYPEVFICVLDFFVWYIYFTRMSSCSVCMSFVRLGHHDG